MCPFWFLLTDGAGPQSEVHGTHSVRDVKRSVKLTLPVFGLASYKFRGSIWTSNGLHERQLSSSLLQAADNWLRLLRVDHPDYSFFVSHYSAFRRWSLIQVKLPILIFWCINQNFIWVPMGQFAIVCFYWHVSFRDLMFLREEIHR